MLKFFVVASRVALVGWLVLLVDWFLPAAIVSTSLPPYFPNMFIEFVPVRFRINLAHTEKRIFYIFIPSSTLSRIYSLELSCGVSGRWMTLRT